MSPADSHRHLLTRLQEQVDAVTATALRGARRVALVNYPNHGNAGDPAVWLGAHASLRRLGVRVGYQCDARSYDPRALAATRPEAILINGGGNLGDLWRQQQRGRERVLADFPRLPTVQLPQSIHFEGTKRLQRMQRLVAGHRDLTLLLRDPASLAFAREHFDAPARLCPDLAFALGPLPRMASARRQLLWLARSDKESTVSVPPSLGLDAEVLDWVGPVDDELRWRTSTRLAQRTNRLLTRQLGQDGGRLPPGAWRLLADTYRPLARARVARGLLILARGEVVVTDRLHGHVLSLLQGIEHVVLDSGTGKTRALVDTFTGDDPLVHWAETPEQALSIAQELLAAR